MKEVMASAGSRNNPVTVRVQLNGVDEQEPLTPTMARSAARIAFGHTLGVTIADDHASYRLNGNRARKSRVPTDEEIGMF